MVSGKNIDANITHYKGGLVSLQIELESGPTPRMRNVAKYLW